MGAEWRLTGAVLLVTGRLPVSIQAYLRAFGSLSGVDHRDRPISGRKRHIPGGVTLLSAATPSFNVANVYVPWRPRRSHLRACLPSQATGVRQGYFCGVEGVLGRFRGFDIVTLFRGSGSPRQSGRTTFAFGPLCPRVPRLPSAAATLYYRWYPHRAGSGCAHSLVCV